MGETDDNIIQLANIPWPTIGTKLSQCPFIDAQRGWLSEFVLLDRELPINQFFDVVPSFAQRRSIKLKHSEPVIEILAKRSKPYHPLQAARPRREDPHATLTIACTADTPH